MGRGAWVKLIVGSSALVGLTGCFPAGPPVSTPTATTAIGDRAAHTATELADGGVLIAGGCVSDGCTTATADAAIVRGDQVTATSPMGTARDAHTATALANGDVIVTGGFTGEGRPPEASVERYVPSSGTWHAAGPLLVARGGHTAATLGSGMVAIAGGWVSSHTYTDSVELFDPATGTSTEGHPLPEAVDGLASIALPDGTVLVTGGQREPGVASDLSVIIRADGTVVPTTGALLAPRFKHTMAVLHDGRVLVIGGTSDDVGLLATSEIYDPVTGTYSPGPALHAGRYKLSGAAAVLDDGRVVVGGGGQGAELIDVDAGRSTALDLLSGVSSFGTVTAADGLLYFVGGYDESIVLRGTFLVTEQPG